MPSGSGGAILTRRANQLEAARDQIAAVASGRVLPMVCDVSAVADIEGAYEQVQATFGRVDILVNNAGKSQAHEFEDIADDV
jgi:NAD(P)-dependent dehydrogenase (short-subunit alcohol dehydrogenase family)